MHAYNIDPDVVSLATVKRAIEVELEHRDIIGNNPELALRIALAHLKESPRYYASLAKLERSEERYWAGRVKPSIFLT
jgi:hypothetical protein